MLSIENEKKLPEPQGKLCIENTLLNFDPYVVPLFSEVEGFEERYLGDEVVQDKMQFGDISITSAHPALKEKLERLLQKNDSIPLSLQDLEEELQQYKNAENEIGASVVTRAKEEGIAQTVDSEYVLSSIKQAHHYPEVVTDSYLKFEFNEIPWRILPNAENHPFLFLRDQSEQNIETFQAVDLDALFALDPEYVRQTIRNYYELRGSAKMLHSIIYNLRQHTEGVEKIVPSFIRDLAAAEQFEHETLNAANLLTWLGSLYELDANVETFRAQLKNQSVPGPETTLPHLRKLYFNEWIHHLQVCPESYAQHQTLEKISTIYDIFSGNVRGSLENFAAVLDIPNLTEKHLHLLHFPLERTKAHGEIQIERLQQERGIELEQSALVRETLEITDYQTFMKKLEEYPESLILYQEFMEWFGTDSRGRNLDYYIDDVVSKIKSGFTFSTFDDIRKMLKENTLYRTSRSSQDFEGAFLDQGLSLYGGRIKDLIPLVCVKRAQDVLSNYPYDKAVHARKIEKLKETLIQILEHKEAAILKFDDWLHDRQIGNEEMKFMCEWFHISPEVVELLAARTMSESKDITNENGLFSMNSFTIAFNMMIVHRGGISDVTSPFIEPILQTIFPKIDRYMVRTVQDYLRGKTN